ncbi:MAG TPA: hypothetical protein VIT44_12380 [Cyclobacteriaceae bacterium]
MKVLTNLILDSMKTFGKLFIMIMLCCGTVQHSIAQSFPTDSITKKFDQYRRQALQEKIYLHTDRNFYLTGEIIWFKIYYVDGSFHRPLDVSKVSYLEIVDRDNESVLQTKVQMKNGAGDGSLFLPASLLSGNYTLRVYTNWMKNFSADFYFQKSISIVNTFIKPDRETKSAKPVYDAQFFPEGGNLVAGLKSKVAFRVIDPSGKGIEFRGSVINDHNDTLASFRPLQFGIGNFDFVPAANTKYRAVIRDNKGNKSLFPLPEVKENGYVMRVGEQNDQLNIEITSSVSNDNSTPVYFFIQSRNILVKTEARALQQGKSILEIKKSDLPEGISHITLFDYRLQPVSERLWFKQPEKKLNFELQTVQKEYDKRVKIVLNVKTTLDANFSISVSKTDSLSQLPEENIFEYLWLSADLKGKIESPEYYVNSSNANLNEAVDNLMLTHGWRRFTWPTILNGKNTYAHVPEYRGHIVNGKITDPSGAPANGILTYFSSPGKLVRIYGSRSNALGEVKYELKDFYDQQPVFVQTDIRKDSIYRLEIIKPFSDHYSSTRPPLLQLPSQLEKQLLNRSVAMQVQSIYYRDQIDRSTPIPIDSISFYGKPDEAYNLDDYTRFPVMEEVLREYVPGIMVRKKKDGFHFMVLDNVNKSLFREDPIVLLDGVPVFDINKIMAYDPLKIKRLEIMDREYYSGTMAFPGIVSYFTYQNELADFEMDSRTLSLNYEGLQLHREFYSPRYESQQERDNHLPDQRSLLYWNPSLKSEKGKPLQIEFYTSDVTGQYEVTIEGISKDGAASSASHTITVNKQNN